jgi:aryl-alcohol dehydrogenase-like predicted oxidoreductase
MDQRMLGRTGVPVSKPCLGAMMFGAWGEPDHDESIRIIHAPLDAGINFIDIADVSSTAESEEIVGKALAGGKRDDVFLATKVGFPMGDDPRQRGASRRRMIRGVEDSLRRLNTDWIDLHQIHRADPNTDSITFYRDGKHGRRPTTRSSPTSPGPSARPPPKRFCAGDCSTTARSFRSP